MSNTRNLKLNFTNIAVHGPEVAAITTVRGDLPDEEELDHELVFIYRHGQWFAYDESEHNLVAATFDESGKELAMMSPDGWVYRNLKIAIDAPSKKTREQIDASDDGPSELVQLRQMRRWPEMEVVAGMARRVYARAAGARRWEPIDQGCFVPRQSRDKTIGFNDIDGWSPQRLVAVGYKGEIWRREGSVWTALESPTNVTLNAVTCVSDGAVFVAVGLLGTLIIGHGDTLRLVEQSVTKGALWSAAHFKGSVYIAGDEGVFRLDAPDFDTPVPIKLRSRGQPSTGYLACGGGVIWSVGDKDIYKSLDGSKWERIPNP